MLTLHFQLILLQMPCMLHAGWQHGRSTCTAEDASCFEGTGCNLVDDQKLDITRLHLDTVRLCLSLANCILPDRSQIKACLRKCPPTLRPGTDSCLR
jgi:hypothetical protein